VAYACLEVYLSSFDKILCSLLQGEFVSLVKFDVWFDLSWVQGEYGLLSLRNLEFFCCPLEF
jgi:hypothetical protein